MIILFLETTVLYMVDTATRCSAASLMDFFGEGFGQGGVYGQSVEGIWLAFVQTWCRI